MEQQFPVQEEDYEIIDEEAILGESVVRFSKKLKGKTKEYLQNYLFEIKELTSEQREELLEIIENDEFSDIEVLLPKFAMQMQMLQLAEKDHIARNTEVAQKNLKTYFRIITNKIKASSLDPVIHNVLEDILFKKTKEEFTILKGSGKDFEKYQAYLTKPQPPKPKYRVLLGMAAGIALISNFLLKKASSKPSKKK